VFNVDNPQHPMRRCRIIDDNVDAVRSVIPPRIKYHELAPEILIAALVSIAGSLRIASVTFPMVLTRKF
jgi:hypothetical protein